MTTTPDPERESFQSEGPLQETPRHGFRGEPHAKSETTGEPIAVTIAISREAGARGTSIGRRVGRKLGWQVYDQELLEYIAQEGAFRQEVFERLSPAASQWVEASLESLLREQNLSQHPSIIHLARVILALGAQGEAILIGRGAGCILSAPALLHVRVLAPLEDRVAYMAQWLRLTREEAAERVRLRDSRRAEFISTHFHRSPTDVYQYDLLLNSSKLGEDLAAELIAEAALEKQARIAAPEGI